MSMVIINENQLKEAILDIQSTLPHTSLLLLRGESEKYPQMRSGKARPNAFDIPELESGWNTIVGRLIEDQNRPTEYKQSILQHYGYPTFYLDLTDNPLVAAWFATNKFTKLEPTKWIGALGFRLYDRTTYEKINDGIGYIHVLEIPNYKKMINTNLLFDITDEDLFIRPQKQSAFLMLDKGDKTCDPNRYLIHTFEIDRRHFCSSYDISDLFPHPNKDIGYKRLLDVPFIKNLHCYTPPDKPTLDESEYNTLDYFYSYSKRIIDIPFYLKEIDDLCSFKPKRNDVTLFEPTIFRNWTQLTAFNLADYFSIQSDVLLSDATKISISPTSLDKMQNSDLNATLLWPEVNSDSILFVKTEYEHDISGHEAPPYFGIWLYKHFDLIIESHLIIEEDGRNGIIHIQPGNVYIIHNNILKVAVQKKIKLEDDIDKSIQVIELFLKMHGLIKNNEVALLPNPFEVDNWHILL